MINYEKLKSVINNLEAEINHYNNNLLKIFPLRNYINLKVQTIPPIIKTNMFPAILV